MSISVSIKEVGGISWIDISSYVIGDLNAFVNLRERDYSITTRGVDIILSYAYPYDYSDIDLVQVDLTVGANSTTVIYTVTKSLDNTNNRTYDITCEHLIAKLKDYNLTYSNLHSEILSIYSGNDEYDAVDFYGYPNVAIWLVIEAMFSKCGFTLDIGSTQKLTTVLTGKDITWDGTTLSSSVDIKLWQIKIDENMLYSLNQSKACYPPIPSGACPDYESDKEITFFDFVSWIAKMFSLDFYPTVSGYGFVLKTDADYVRTVTNDLTFEYKYESFVKQRKHADWSILAHEDRSLYGVYASSGTTLKDTYYEPTTETNQTWYNNLLFLIANPSDNTKPAPLGRFLISTTDVKNYITPEDLIVSGFNFGARVKTSETQSYSKESISTSLFAPRESTLKQNIAISSNEQLMKIERIV